MSRSVKKGSFVHTGLLKKIEEINRNGDRKTIKIRSGSPAIFLQMMGHTIAVHSGGKHIPIYVTEDMVGHKLGELVLTRAFKGHIKNEKTSKGE